MLPFMDCSKQAKVVQDVRSRESSCLQESGTCDGEGPGGFWGAGTILLLDVGGNYTGVFGM